MDSRADEASAKTQKSAINDDLEAAFKAELARQRERFARAERGLLEPGASLLEAGRALESWLSGIELPGGLGWHRDEVYGDYYFLGYHTFAPYDPLQPSAVKYLSVGIYTGGFDCEDDDEAEYMNDRGPWLECRELDGKDTFHFHKDQEDFISMTMDDVDGFVSARVARSLRLHAVRVVEGAAPPPFVRQPNLERLGGYAGFFGLLLVSVLAAAATGLLGSSAGLGVRSLLLPCVAAAGIAPFVAYRAFDWLRKRPLREAVAAWESGATP